MYYIVKHNKMSTELNQIYIDETKLLPVKNMLNQTIMEKNDKVIKQIKSDCEILKNAFIDIINNKIPANITNTKKNNTIIGEPFKLEIINNLNGFENNCNYKVYEIEKDLSKMIGVNTYIYLNKNRKSSNDYNLSINLPYYIK